MGKLQLALLFACVLAFSAANKLDDVQAKGSAAFNDAIGKAQNALDSNNIDLNLSEIASNVKEIAEKEIESRQLAKEADKLAKKANNLAEEGKQAKDTLNNSGLSKGVK